MVFSLGKTASFMVCSQLQFSFCFTSCVIFWYAKIYRVNKRLILNSSNLGLIPKLYVNEFWKKKCDFLCHAKRTKS